MKNIRLIVLFILAIILVFTGFLFFKVVKWTAPTGGFSPGSEVTVN